jgi:hypothetical protein
LYFLRSNTKQVQKDEIFGVEEGFKEKTPTTELFRVGGPGDNMKTQFSPNIALEG